MRLLLRAQDIAWTSLGLSENGKVIHMERLASRPETILNVLMERLVAWGVPLQKIKDLAVVTGPGSFTALRSSLTIVNVMGFVRQWPLIGCTATVAATDERLFKKMAASSIAAVSVLTPHYGAKALITKPKRQRSLRSFR